MWSVVVIQSIPHGLVSVLFALRSFFLTQERPLPTHRRLVLAVGGSSSHAAVMALVEDLLSGLPELREVVLAPLTPEALPSSAQAMCEALLIRTSASPRDDPSWRGVSLLPVPTGAVLACAVTHRTAVLPGAVGGGDAAAAAALQTALALYGRRLHCWALGRRTQDTARLLCAAPPAPGAPDADVAVVLLDRAVDLVQALRHGKRLGDALGCVTQRWSPVSSDLRVRTRVWVHDTVYS